MCGPVSVFTKIIPLVCSMKLRQLMLQWRSVELSGGWSLKAASVLLSAPLRCRCDSGFCFIPRTSFTLTLVCLSLKFSSSSSFTSTSPALNSRVYHHSRSDVIYPVAEADAADVKWWITATVFVWNLAAFTFIFLLSVQLLTCRLWSKENLLAAPVCDKKEITPLCSAPVGVMSEITHSRLPLTRLNYSGIAWYYPAAAAILKAPGGSASPLCILKVMEFSLPLALFLLLFSPLRKEWADGLLRILFSISGPL